MTVRRWDISHTALKYNSTLDYKISNPYLPDMFISLVISFRKTLKNTIAAPSFNRASPSITIAICFDAPVTLTQVTLLDLYMKTSISKYWALNREVMCNIRQVLNCVWKHWIFTSNYCHQHTGVPFNTAYGWKMQKGKAQYSLLTYIYMYTVLMKGNKIHLK